MNANAGLGSAPLPPYAQADRLIVARKGRNHANSAA